MANFVFGRCPNSAQNWSKFASHSVYSDARHVFSEMSQWRPCGAAAHHPSCRVSKRPRPSKCGRRAPLAPLLTPRRSLSLLPRLNAGERPHPAMAVAELRAPLPFLLLRSLSISTKRVIVISSSGRPTCAPFLAAAAGRNAHRRRCLGHGRRRTWSDLLEPSQAEPR